MRASVTEAIDRPANRVWAFVADPANLDRWVIGVSDPHVQTSGPLGLDSTITVTYSYGRRRDEDMTYRVTTWEPPRRFGMAATDGPFPVDILIEVADEGRTARVTTTVDAGPDSFGTRIIFALFGPLLRRGMRKRMRKELGVVRSILER